MSKITAYKSEHTGELFETKEAYDQHLTFIKEKDEKKLLLAQTEAKKHEPRLTAVSIEDFRQKAFAMLKTLTDGKLCEFNFYISSFFMLGNTHSAPIGKKTNFTGKEVSVPTGYLGWNGKITLKYSCSDTWDLSHIVKNFPGINSGSGGSGAYHLQLFIDDFPLLGEKYAEYTSLLEKERENALNRMSLWTEKDKMDVTIAHKKLRKTELTHELDLIKERLKLINTEIDKKQTENREAVWAENQFDGKDRLEELKKELSL